MPSAPPPYHFPPYDFFTVEVDWPLGGDPTLTWTAPSELATEIHIWRASSADWTVSTDISGAISPSLLTYTDTTATRDGTAYYYWPVAQNAANTLASTTFAVACIANEQTVSQTDTSSLNLLQGLNIVAGGTWRASLTFAYTDPLCVPAYEHPIGQPNNPYPDVIAMQSFGGAGAAQNDLTAWNTDSSSWSVLEFQAPGGTPAPGPPGGATEFPNLPPVTPGAGSWPVLDNLPNPWHWVSDFVFSPTPSPPIPPDIPAGNNFDSWSVTFTSKYSYVSPPGGAGNQGQGSFQGGGVGLAPLPPGAFPLPLPRPTPVPLPCIPCCQTSCGLPVSPMTPGLQ